MSTQISKNRDSSGSLNYGSFLRKLRKVPIPSDPSGGSLAAGFNLGCRHFIAPAYKAVSFSEKNECREGHILTELNVFTNIHPLKNIASKCHSKSSLFSKF